MTTEQSRTSRLPTPFVYHVSQRQAVETLPAPQPAQSGNGLGHRLAPRHGGIKKPLSKIADWL